MAPSDTPNYHPDVSPADSKLCGDYGLRDASCRVAGFNALDGISRKNRAAVAFSVRVPIFFDLVGDIISSSADKEVIWPDAPWIVARVQNKHVFGDWSICKLIRESMGVDLSWPARSETSIPVWFSPTSPQPAAFSFFNVAPEANRNTVSVMFWGHGVLYPY